MGRYIELYPADWLYNAAVVGFLQFLDDKEGLKDVYFFEDNYVRIDLDVFKNIPSELYHDKGKAVINLVGNNPNYPNFIDTKREQVGVFEDFLRALSDPDMRISGGECNFCVDPVYIRLDTKGGAYKNLSKDNKDAVNFFKKLEQFGMVHNKHLGASFGEFPNLYWSLENSLKICHLCSFLFVHHHLAFVNVSGVSVFVNAPSFQVMYYLNRFVKEFSAKSSKDQVLKILGMSLIRNHMKLRTMLDKWTGMNIEVVVKKPVPGGKFVFDFYSLPYRAVDLFLDEDIASLVDKIGEFSVMEWLLEGEYEKFVEALHYLIGFKLGKDSNKERLKNYFAYFKESNIDPEKVVKLTKLVSKLYGKIADREYKHGSSRSF